jgi:hypothetical protein
MRRALVVALLAAGFASTASAQQDRGGGLILSANGGYLGLNFRESAKAVLGSSGGGTFGGDAGFIFGDHLFVSVAAHRFSKNGERVFVAEPGGTVFKLGHPLKLQLVPAQLTIGWRFFETRVLGLRLTPYLGLGGGLVSYREESTIAGETRTFSVKKPGGHGLAGVELGGGPLRFAVEASYASVPNALGDSPDGVSKVYGEKDIGGFTVLGKIVFTTSKR